MRCGRLLSLVGTAALALALPGCGLMFGGVHETIQISSSPDSAKVTTVPPTSEFVTPATIRLERKNDYSLTFEKPGYSTGHFQIQHHMRGGILALDVIFTGLLGVIPDAATGAWNGLTPRTATVTMTKVALVPGPDSIRVGVHIGSADGQENAAVVASGPGVTVRVEPQPRKYRGTP